MEKSEVNKVVEALELLAGAIKYHADVIGYGADRKNDGSVTLDLTVTDQVTVEDPVAEVPVAETTQGVPGLGGQALKPYEVLNVETQTVERAPGEVIPAPETGVTVEELETLANKLAVSKSRALAIETVKKYAADFDLKKLTAEVRVALKEELDKI